MAQTNHTEQHTLIALVEDKPGVLTRVASMFRRRGFNIASLAVGNSEQPGLSRMTFVVNGDDYTVGQVAKQLDKLIDVIEVSDITKESIVTRELALLKVTTTPMTRGEIIQIVNLFRANIIDVGSESMVIEITGEQDKTNALNALLQPFGIIEMHRTGVVAMVRGQANGLATGYAGRCNGSVHN
ncbi:MAG: acetolactate synthase small subunit [Chloroflexi bacterium]|nr:acetolactate synthase small subunit [Chloroflexota bacterium]MDA1269708.1 acetolactate synthase small subunit [Chloroflexota bacterium]PKB58062.1 MAG: acetolactate synthase small subunit [SAR202 cluster bacterium Casp-Chloro-G2]